MKQTNPTPRSSFWPHPFRRLIQGLILTILSLTTALAEELKPEAIEDYTARMQWFADSQYGMFIHFGLYSHLGGEWKGEPVDWYAEWIQASKNIPRDEYAQIITTFNPVHFDAYKASLGIKKAETITVIDNFFTFQNKKLFC